MPKIYLSAAAHATDNSTKCPTACGENTHCNAYMDIVEKGLKAQGIEVKRTHKTKTGNAAMSSRVKDANAWGADIYYVAHTNAGGGRYSMTMCYPNSTSQKKADVFHKYRKCVKTHYVRTRKDLYEINATKMVCLYDELIFHDNADDCAWFHNGGMEKLAEETVKALCEIVGVKYKAPAATTSTATKTETKTEAAKAATKAGDKVTLNKGKLYVSSTSKVAVTRTGTFYLYDGQKINGRYRVTNKPANVGKKPLAWYVSGWAVI